MKKILSWFVNHKDYFIPAGITLLVLLMSFIVKGVAPFGKNYTGLIDYDAGLVPSYTHLWDFIHGESNFLFNENLGMGSNIYASSVLNTFFSPISYLIGLSSRDGIRHFIGYIVVIKLMLMATTSYIIFKKWFKKVDYKVLTVFSLIWTFSSWMLVHISNVGWLDVMIIFPFLIDSIKYLIEKGRISYFVSMLSLCLVYSYYMSYMILIMMILLLTCACFTIIEKQDRKRVIGQMFIGTLFSLLISMFAFLPSFIQTQASYRFSDDAPLIEGNYFYTKIIMLFFYAILIYLPFKLFKHRKEDNVIKFLLYFLILTLLPVVIEPINKMWHTGSYFSYPFRFSYIPTFFAIIASLYYFNTYYEKDLVEQVQWKGSKKEILTYVLPIIALMGYIAMIVTNVYLEFHLAFTSRLLNMFLYLLGPVLVLIIICILFNCFKKENRKLFLLGVSLFQILVMTIGYMGVKPSNQVISTINVANEFDIDSLDDSYALKDDTRELMSNFPLIVDHKSMSTWLHINGMYGNENAQALGYGHLSTQIESYGGTVFSDLLANVRYILSYEVLDGSLYNLLETNEVVYDGKVQTVYLYEYKYNLPTGLVVSKDLDLIDLDVEEDPFFNQNMLYKKIFNKSDDIISVDEYKRVSEKDINLTISDAQNVYLYFGEDDCDSITIKINGKEIEYLQGNGIINLGVYKNTTLDISVASEKEIEKMEIATIDIIDIVSLVSENNNEVKVEYKGNKVFVTLNSTSEGMLYLPINYENNSWSATNNGVSGEVNRFLETYISVEVKEGKNEIILTFTPQMMKEGIIISLATLLVVALLFAINIKYKFFKNKYIVMVLGTIGIVLGVAIGGYIYLIPLTK